MTLSEKQTRQIKRVIRTLYESRQKRFPTEMTETRNAPFHDIMFKAFQLHLQGWGFDPTHLASVASWLHGLNTALGGAFEIIAHILCNGRKRSFTQSDTLKISPAQADAINELINALKRGSRKPNLKEEDQLILGSISKDDPLQNALGFVADVYRETDSLIECIEMKSVRPNAGEGRGEKVKILNGKAALKRLYPDKEIRFYIGFPFDPTSSDDPTGYDKTRFMSHLVEFRKYFAADEVLVASELWDHLSGQTGTMEEILRLFTETIEELRRQNAAAPAA